eukprot:CAMPEP_0117651604 /NCGR_PEP_ID=MMETSP0804-20121206/2182_1 /TAXON_ID=1074897 /ORGANISM="Tetraselmis astigmatica, Strain CCMP880" /LENGTH=597 /DNA_ID=CAMNT_0005457595 /DNA_START=246 /DNA_END=2036 /DNA_ORIENTATION=-
MDDDESQIPLAAAPQVQYFDVSDVESTDTEPEAGALTSGELDDDDVELEVFGDEADGGGDGIGAPSEIFGSACLPPQGADPFGIKQLAVKPPAPLRSAPQQLVFFDGAGIEGGSAMHPGDELEDEFDYAFEGQSREGETHKRVFKAENIPVPKGLLTNVKSSQLGSLCEEEEEEMEEQGQPMNGDHGEGAALPAGSLESEQQAWLEANARVLEREGDPAAAVLPQLKSRPTAASQSFEVDSGFVEHGGQASPAEVVVQHASHVCSQQQFTPSVPAAAQEAEQGAVPFAADFVDLGDIDIFGSGDSSPVASSSPAGGADEADDPWQSANAQLDQQASASYKPKKEKKKKKKKEKRVKTAAITSAKAWEHFQSEDIGIYVGSIVEDDSSGTPGSCWGRLMAMLAPQPKLNNPGLLEERRRIFCYAKIAFRNADDVHYRILASVYQNFTSAAPVSRYGSHWADVGFQGDDPATDLRGCGMLGLLQLLYLWDHNPSNAATVYRLSRHPEQEFPLAVVAMNVTKWCLQVLRSGQLAAAANSLQSVTEAANAFYVGVFYFFYDTWLTRKATMRESGHVLKDIELQCKKSVKKMLQLSKQTSLW